MAAKIRVGSRVARGRDWKVGWSFDGTPPRPGTVTSVDNGMAAVAWDWNGKIFTGFTVGDRGRYSLKLLPSPMKFPLPLSDDPGVLDFAAASSSVDVDIKNKSLTLISTAGSLGGERTRTLVNLHCDESPPWSRLVLERLAPTVEVLHLVNPEEQHLQVVGGMPHLRELHVSLRRATGQQLEQVSAMSRLTCLEAHCPSDSPLPALRFAAAKPPAGLQLLRTGVYPLRTALALMRAHAATLRELHLVAASEEPYGCPDLARELRRCRLDQLQKLVLLRGTADEKFCRHTDETCKQQKRKIWDAFVEVGVALVVQCSECNPVE